MLSYDEASGTTGAYTVTAVLVNHDPAIEYLTLDDETLTPTPEHPFYTREAGWVAAGDLAVGEHVRHADGTWGTVTRLLIVQHPQTMYNLTVAHAHTFFVGHKALARP